MMDERLVRKREDVERDDEQEQDGQLPAGDDVPPELVQLAGLLLQSFLAGDRESVEALYEMYHEPEKFVERQRNAVKEMLKELLADGVITAEQAKAVEQALPAEQSAGDKVETPPAQTQVGDSANGELQIQADAQRINQKGKTLHEILGITR